MEDSGWTSSQSGGGERRRNRERKSVLFLNGNPMYEHSTDWPPVHREATRPSEAAVTAKPWGYSNPITNRRKRLPKFKVYSVECRVKVLIRNGLRWIKRNKR